ncbi:MAG TPA: SET domain-containing protein [Candidatus Eisenbacteria bacterium]
MADGPSPTDTLPLSSHPAGTLLPCDSELVGVLVTRNGRHLVAIRPIALGTHLFTIEGREIPAPTRYSVQVGPSLHLDQDCARDEIDLVRRYFWRYLDHACEPTTVIRDRRVIAIREIAEGDCVSFDYNTTEYDMAEPFQCHCGSDQCVGLVRGARHLTPAQRARVAQWLPEYLRSSPPAT